MSDEKKDFIREIIAADLKSGKHAAPITRFPPEPNGYLHIGHAKAIGVNFGIAGEYAGLGARCHLRFDDTNPVKEDTEYVESIKRDIEWLGYDWGEHLYFASDYFDYFYDCAVALIEKGLAYVDTQTPDEIRAQRGNVSVVGTPSPHRERSAEENLALFKKMREGGFKDGGAVLRANIDMESFNMNMRDPVLYRVVHAPHHNTGDKWCIYPMYDFAHPLEDAKEHITHSLCSLEFENHRPLYDWVVENCPVPSKPRQIEFARLNIGYTVMSKRKFIQLVDEKHVDGWDDPRMSTLSGMRRRGYPPEAIRAFVERVGLTKQNSLSDFALLEFEVRNYLNKVAQRKMAILDPIKVIITNYPEGESEKVTVPNNPENDDDGSRELTFTREFWIERDDFMIEAPKKYFRLKPGGAVRLRGAYIIQHVDHVLGENGEVSEVHCEFIPDTIGKSAPEGVQCRTAIHWVSCDEAVDAEVRLYDRLFTEEVPDNAEGGYLSCLNPDSLSVVTGAKVEPSLAAMVAGERCQFERIGYFCADSVDHSPDKPVFNRISTLRDSWGAKK
ncbi:glutamine--tRNA ligase/YqeY domain fusion protein [bacterium]|jgi:glutaminyl-tRNA synthetase|nr:glutamine--tRNA ligase/YqeY domain fusion protein [Akkermansiaceae bacterium]MDB4422609.1 glutamine--tRNA ligase/YqeY domain fusion protein [bacterium]MDA7891925.1 glutamine--tRNA ligase/YqeY domain fusion protein [Akkermansiaceae bacterium]MDA7929720.1 glutamine--tRNA ligase/YqeY domain fusion protein [Akkermansiaceae bacterium]MDB4484233.1 glutamine--tRNA ligase/YqeY domain fusion protein [bacterium]